MVKKEYRLKNKNINGTISFPSVSLRSGLSILLQVSFCVLKSSSISGSDNVTEVDASEKLIESNSSITRFTQWLYTSIVESIGLGSGTCRGAGEVGVGKRNLLFLLKAGAGGVSKRVLLVLEVLGGGIFILSVGELAISPKPTSQ